MLAVLPRIAIDLMAGRCGAYAMHRRVGRMGCVGSIKGRRPVNMNLVRYNGTELDDSGVTCVCVFLCESVDWFYL